MQAFYRQAFTTIDDLQATLDSPWPLYSIISQAAAICTAVYSAVVVQRRRRTTTA